jgi:hypothetical protein
LFGTASVLPAAADPALLGTFKNWSAYSTSTATGKTCYALAAPQSKEPAKAKRDPIFFLISDWPDRKVKGEAEVVPGYKYKSDSKVTAQVGSDKFSFFTKNDGDDGVAWMQNVDDEARLVDSLRTGAQLIITGTSARGTLTHDTYSLDGVSAALDRIHSECGM